MRQVFLRRGISSYVGVLLLVALSVAGGVIFIALSGSLCDFQPRKEIPLNQIILDSAFLNHRELIVYIRNSGKNTIEIDKIYIDDVLVTEPESVIEVNDPGESDDVIQGGEVGKLIVQPLSGFNRGKNFKFKIISKNNEVLEFNRKAPVEAPRVVFTDSRNKGVSGILVQYRFNGWQDLGVTDENGEVLLLLEPRRYELQFHKLYPWRPFKIFMAFNSPGTIIQGYTLSRGKSVKYAQSIMDYFKINSVIILNNKTPCGIITKSDIKKRIDEMNLDPHLVNVEHIMSSPIFFITTETTQDEADSILRKNQISQLPIISKTDKGIIILGLYRPVESNHKFDSNTQTHKIRELINTQTNCKVLYPKTSAR